MPVGVKISEIDASLYSRISNNGPVLAIVGTATKGPIGIPTLCISQKDLKNKFGLQDPNCFGIYAANYFLVEADTCYYVRVAKDAKYASKTIKATRDGEAVDLFKIRAVTPGTFYNNYKITITTPKEKVIETGENGTPTEVTKIIPGKVNIDLKTPAGLLVESYKNLDLIDKTSESYIGTVLIKSSDNIRFESADNVDATTTDSITETDYILDGGDNGITNLATDQTNDQSSSLGEITETSCSYYQGINALKSDTLRIELMAAPGVYDEGIIHEALDLCTSRGDTLFIIDPPKGYDYEDVINWHNGVAAKEGDDACPNLNCSHGALYWSWQWIRDEVSGADILVPPSVLVPAMIARSTEMSEPWIAPAGLTRGLIKNALRSEFVPDSSEVDLLYSDPNNINPIITHPSAGLTVFGQKTVWRNPTALNRINVRRLITYIRYFVKDVCDYLVFEPNDPLTWTSFQDLIEPRLISIKENRGLYDYKIVKGEDIVTAEDIDNYRMPAQILIKPTKAAEFIPIDLVITSTGANFNDSGIYAD